MKRRTLELALAMLMLSEVVAPAAQRPPRNAPQGERPGLQMRERIVFSLAELKLTDEQKTKVDAILANARQGLESLREQVQAMEPRERMERTGAFFQSVRDDLSAVLNEEQRAILEQKLGTASALTPM